MASLQPMDLATPVPPPNTALQRAPRPVPVLWGRPWPCPTMSRARARRPAVPPTDVEAPERAARSSQGCPLHFLPEQTGPGAAGEMTGSGEVASVVARNGGREAAADTTGRTDAARTGLTEIGEEAAGDATGRMGAAGTAMMDTGGERHLRARARSIDRVFAFLAVTGNEGKVAGKTGQEKVTAVDTTSKGAAIATVYLIVRTLSTLFQDTHGMMKENGGEAVDVTAVMHGQGAAGGMAGSANTALFVTRNRGREAVTDVTGRTGITHTGTTKNGEAVVGDATGRRGAADTATMDTGGESRLRTSTRGIDRAFTTVRRTSSVKKSQDTMGSGVGPRTAASARNAVTTPPSREGAPPTSSRRRQARSRGTRKNCSPCERNGKRSNETTGGSNRRCTT